MGHMVVTIVTVAMEVSIIVLYCIYTELLINVLTFQGTGVAMVVATEVSNQIIVKLIPK